MGLFPFLFGGTFIEGPNANSLSKILHRNFPSFSEGLSLREPLLSAPTHIHRFPFLFGGTFIEGTLSPRGRYDTWDFPSFSEGLSLRDSALTPLGAQVADFPSFSEGLSLREVLPSLSVRVWVYFPSFSEGLSLRVFTIKNNRAQ